VIRLVRFDPIRSWWRGILLCALLTLLTATPTAAQTLRPVVVEYKGNRVRAKFELVNEGLRPLNVILEPKSFDVTEAGEAIYRPLDPSIHLKLSSMSVRIPPRQTHIIFFEVQAESLPAWFVIPCTFAGMPRRSGLEIQVELPHTVYLLQKEPITREDVWIRRADYQQTEKCVLVDIVNRGQRLGRVLGAEVTAKGHRQTSASFPLLPRRSRQIQVPWDSPQPPEKLILRFQGFTIERPLGEASQASG
jgi:hypothetical protein